MGKINRIKGNKRTKETPRLFMVSVSADIWAKGHKDASEKLAAAINRIRQTMYYEATEMCPANHGGHSECLGNGKDIKIT